MAFGFLKDIGSALSPLAPAVKAGGMLWDIFRDRKNRAADTMRATLGAAINPEDPRFRNLAALFEEKAKEDAIRGVMEADRARRAATARGDMPALSERRDESRYKALSRSFQDAGRFGNQQAMQALTGAAPQFDPLVNYDAARDQGRSRRVLTGVEALADVLQDFGKKAPTPDMEYFQPSRKALGYTEF